MAESSSALARRTGRFSRHRRNSGTCARRPTAPTRTTRFRGKTYDFESLLQARAPGFAHETTVEKRRARFMQCRSALEALGRKFNEVAPDAVVILGNDQREFFNPA